MSRSEDDLKASVQKILQSVFPAGNGSFEDSCGPCEVKGWNSLGHLNLVLALNEEFDISLEFDEIMAIGCVGDIFAVLRQRNISGSK